MAAVRFRVCGETFGCGLSLIRVMGHRDQDNDAIK